MNIPQTTEKFQLDTPVIQKTLVERADGESAIRPMTTTAFTRGWTSEPFDFPRLENVPNISYASESPIPVSTRMIIQNALLVQRHFEGKNSS
jgi:hypothetical protein